MVTVDDIDDIGSYRSEADRRQFCVDLFNLWGVGDRERNTGLLIAMIMKRRRLEIVTGDGLRPVLLDHWIKDMQMRVRRLAICHSAMASAVAPRHVRGVWFSTFDNVEGK
eukprot:SAG11_NODE_1927_length_4054_cov_4.221492_2_plen_110_part_00